MARDFSGAVADAYVQYRRGYPEPVIDAIVDTLGLGVEDLAVDLGCGSGQLTLPLAGRVRAIVGMDPEPDMLRHARAAAEDRHITNATWLIGADRDVPALRRLLGEGSIGALTVAVAIHWMDRDRLFRDLRPLVRSDGGIAVVTNGTPLWLQDADWSRALRSCIEAWTGKRNEGSCQTDEAGRRLNTVALAAAGYRVVESAIDYDAPLSIEQIVGGIVSASSSDAVPSDEQRQVFAQALRPFEPITEHVRVSLQFGLA